MTLFRNKYRSESTRLKNWDYGRSGAYFMTICTKNREHFFGEIGPVDSQCIANLQCIANQQSIANQQCNTNLQNPTDKLLQTMKLSEIGKLVEFQWLQTPEIRPDMNISLGAFVVMPNHLHGIIIIGENEYNIEKSKYQEFKNQFGPQRKNLSAIIRGFKSTVTIQAKNILPNFKWQSGYHDHIIRNYEEYVRIENYIINNPQNWKEDKFNH